MDPSSYSCRPSSVTLGWIAGGVPRGGGVPGASGRLFAGLHTHNREVKVAFLGCFPQASRHFCQNNINIDDGGCDSSHYGSDDDHDRDDHNDDRNKIFTIMVC